MELDVNVISDVGCVLIICLVRNLLEGCFYIVVLCDLVNSEGESIELIFLFCVYCDGLRIGELVFEVWCDNMNVLFDILEMYGVEWDGLVQVWLFMVVSQKSFIECMLYICDQVFVGLGGGVLVFIIDQVGEVIQGEFCDGLSWGISGIFEVFNFFNQFGGVFGFSFNYNGSDDFDVLLVQLNGDDIVIVCFCCQVLDIVVVDFGDLVSLVILVWVVFYGYGLFGEGSGGEFCVGNVCVMQIEYNIMFCVMDWIGMVQEDFVVGVIYCILVDVLCLLC